MIDRTKKLPARFYVSPTGRNPVREWILELPSEDRQTVGKDIQKVEFGWPIGRPHCAPLGHGLWEVRSDLDSNRIARAFDEFLSEQGMLGACEERAIKEIIAEQLAEAMKAQGITKSAMAERMRTSRRQLDRLLDPATPSVTLETLRRAANAVGRTLRVELT